MVQNHSLKRYCFVLLCLGIALTAASFITSRGSAQTTTYPPLEYCLGQIGSAGNPGDISVQAVSAITLVSFCVEYDPDTDQVLVTWETATETNTAGYVIWRSTTENGTYQAVSPFILAEGGLVAMAYEWVDPDVQKGSIYYYKLQEINTDNISVYFYGPVMFDFFSPTATATPTGTLTVVAANTGTATPTRTKTPALVWTSQVILTNTPTPSATPTEAPQVEESLPYPQPLADTASFQPLPPFQLMFPEPTATPKPEEVAMLQVDSREIAQAEITKIELRPNMTARIWLLGLIVVLLWIVLGSFLVVYLRKAQG